MPRIKLEKTEDDDVLGPGIGISLVLQNEDFLLHFVRLEGMTEREVQDLTARGKSYAFELGIPFQNELEDHTPWNGSNS